METRKRFWGEGKISNVINECLEELYEEGTLTKPEEKTKQPAKPVNKKTKEEAPKVVNKTAAKKSVTKPVKENKPKAATPSVNKKDKSDSKVPTSDKATSGAVQQNAEVPSSVKEEDKTVPVANLKGKKNKKPQTEKDELKAAKAAEKAVPKNGKTKMTVIKTTEVEGTPSKSGKTAKTVSTKFQAVIYKKDGQYGCYIKGYQDEVHVKNINDIKKVKGTYAKALQEYIKKAQKVNRKATNEQSVKGKLYKLLPTDLTMSNIQFHDIGELKDAM